MVAGQPRDGVDGDGHEMIAEGRESKAHEAPLATTDSIDCSRTSLECGERESAVAVGRAGGAEKGAGIARLATA